jgi:hypothetical protein
MIKAARRSVIKKSIFCSYPTFVDHNAFVEVEGMALNLLPVLLSIMPLRLFFLLLTQHIVDIYHPSSPCILIITPIKQQILQSPCKLTLS